MKKLSTSELLDISEGGFWEAPGYGIGCVLGAGAAAIEWTVTNFIRPLGKLYCDQHPSQC